MRNIRIFDISERQKVFDILNSRNEGDLSEIERTVSAILSDIKKIGDASLFEYTKKYDGFDIDENNIEVSAYEIDEAFELVSDDLVEIIKKSAENIRAFHEKQKRKTWIDTDGGIELGQLFNPIERCGVYVPGGKAAYPSSVLMNVVPAKVAGVPEIIMATPPSKEGKINPLILVSARIAGANRIFKMGGAQAIGALAYGTNSVPSVYKITGPGNAYVAAAKKQVFGKVGIDMIAGPSEILVIDDGSADLKFIAADVLSQAEHDELSSCIAVVPTMERAECLSEEILAQANILPKKDIAMKSLTDYGMIVVAKDVKSAIEFANEVAPEHLELCIKSPKEYLSMIKNAGAVFLGAFSPEPLGDYYAGPNHVLPTNGTARFSSPLNVDDFIKKTSVIGYEKDELEKCYKDIKRFAKEEGLDAHAKSISIRFEKGNE